MRSYSVIEILAVAVACYGVGKLRLVILADDIVPVDKHHLPVRIGNLNISRVESGVGIFISACDCSCLRRLCRCRSLGCRPGGRSGCGLCGRSRGRGSLRRLRGRLILLREKRILLCGYGLCGPAERLGYGCYRIVNRRGDFADYALARFFRGKRRFGNLAAFAGQRAFGRGIALIKDGFVINIKFRSGGLQDFDNCKSKNL